MFTLGTLATIAVFLLTACGVSPSDPKPYSTTSPASPTADDVQDLYKLVFWLALVVFVGVQFAIVYTALRFRRRKQGGNRPPQIHGNKRLEIIWTIIPAIVLLIVLIPTITTLYDHDAAADNGDIQIDVYGKQWWWEIHYRDADGAEGDDEVQVVTANELYLPVGVNATINLYSNNVIHSFWVPRLSGKMDVIPGHDNRLSITPSEAGEYFGECAEFCGAQHAWMRFKVIAQPQEQFESTLNAYRTGNPGDLDAEAADAASIQRVPAAFAVCLACHGVNGVGGNTGGLESPYNFGPDLTNIACRRTIAAGMLQNNPENMAIWLDNPNDVKPGNYMSTQITDGLLRTQFGEEGFQELLTYLGTLQPAGGCASIGQVNHLGVDNPVTGATPEASPEASPVASPEATPAT